MSDLTESMGTRRRFGRETPSGPTYIVGFDGSAGSFAAIDWASDMVEGEGRLVIAGVAPPASGEAQRIGVAMRGLVANPALVERRWTTESRQGWEAADVLVRAAHEHKAQAIVVGAHGMDPSHVFIGSVAHRLLQISDVPVIVVPGRRRSHRWST